jgi:hypothetical protein
LTSVLRRRLNADLLLPECKNIGREVIFAYLARRALFQQHQEHQDPQDSKASKALRYLKNVLPWPTGLQIFYFGLLRPLGDPQNDDAPMTRDRLQNRLDQASGRPGVGRTEYFLAVSGPFSSCSSWVIFGLKQLTNTWSKIEGIDHPSRSYGDRIFLPSPCGLTLSW